jgi:hypothetical protein
LRQREARVPAKLLKAGTRTSLKNFGISDTLIVGLLSAVPDAIGSVGTLLINHLFRRTDHTGKFPSDKTRRERPP